MKTTIKNILLAFIAMTALYSCSSNGGDNPEPKTETGVRKNMSVVITTSGDLSTHAITIALTGIIKPENDQSSGQASPMIDDRDDNPYPQIVYTNEDLKADKTISSHSQKEVNGILFAVSIEPKEEIKEGNISINIKVYSNKKLIDDKTYNSAEHPLKQMYEILADQK